METPTLPHSPHPPWLDAATAAAAAAKHNPPDGGNPGQQGKAGREAGQKTGQRGWQPLAAPPPPPQSWTLHQGGCHDWSSCLSTNTTTAPQRKPTTGETQDLCECVCVSSIRHNPEAWCEKEQETDQSSRTQIQENLFSNFTQTESNVSGRCLKLEAFSRQIRGVKWLLLLYEEVSHSP